MRRKTGARCPTTKVTLNVPTEVFNEVKAVALAGGWYPGTIWKEVAMEGIAQKLVDLRQELRDVVGAEVVPDA